MPADTGIVPTVSRGGRAAAAALASRLGHASATCREPTCCARRRASATRESARVRGARRGAGLRLGRRRGSHERAGLLRRATSAAAAGTSTSTTGAARADHRRGDRGGPPLARPGAAARRRRARLGAAALPALAARPARPDRPPHRRRRRRRPRRLGLRLAAGRGRRRRSPSRRRATEREARRVAGFLRGLDLGAAARFDGDGDPVPGRAAQGDAWGWAAAAARAAGLPDRRRRPPPAWRNRADYQEKSPGDYLANAIASAAHSVDGPETRLYGVKSAHRHGFGTRRGLVREAGEPGLRARLGGGLGGAAVPASRPLPGGRARP